MQSLNDADLKDLGRNHDAAAARRAIAQGRAAFARLSLDLIYALPGQTAAAWADQLRAAVDLGAEHISPYQLTIEPGTAFDRQVRRGVLNIPGHDLAADLYETTQAVLSAAGFDAYEVSNHARGLAARSRHNLNYWRGHDYVGVGPGAHGRITLAGVRHATEAPRAVAAYVAKAGGAMEPLAARDVALERLLMGLRTSEGVALDELRPLNIDSAALAPLVGLLQARSNRLYATAKGRQVLDSLIAKLANAA